MLKPLKNQPFQNVAERGESLCGGILGVATGDIVEPVDPKIAALYVQSGGAYYGLPGVDAWDEIRDARRYDGPHPVVAHPPCQRWGKMWFGQPLAVKLTGVRKIKGDDGGCFAAALTAVRKFGGVLEHPWGSHAWPHFGLNRPPRSGGWIAADMLGGWTCCVEQGRYGHYARKPTMLYAFGVDLPELLWGHSEAKLDPAVVERMGLKRAKRLGEVGARGGGTDSTARIHTPAPFRDLLLSIAASAAGDIVEPVCNFNQPSPRAAAPSKYRVKSARLVGAGKFLHNADVGARRK